MAHCQEEYMYILDEMHLVYCWWIAPLDWLDCLDMSKRRKCIHHINVRKGKRSAGIFQSPITICPFRLMPVPFLSFILHPFHLFPLCLQSHLSVSCFVVKRVFWSSTVLSSSFTDSQCHISHTTLWAGLSTFTASILLHFYIFIINIL